VEGFDFDRGQLARYLAVLGMRPARPSLGHLQQLVTAQLTRIPFENISKLLAKQRGQGTIPGLEQYLDGVERHSFGGTCYVNNPYFNLLLNHLGYDAALCGADMSAPDVHVVTVVQLEGREHLVDVGYAAPFYEPLPLDLDRYHVVDFGATRYVLHPRDELGRSRMDLLRDGERVHGYLAKPEPRRLGDFENVIRASYRPSATFMNAVVVERFFTDRSVRIHNLTLTESTVAESTVTRLAGTEQLVAAVEQRCGIAADLVREAVEGLQLDGDIYA
jgi:arylamine N-acetyltransferase